MVSVDRQAYLVILRKQQEALNQAIDAYIDLSPSTGSKEAGDEVARQRINYVSSKIASLTVDTAIESILIGLQPLVNLAIRMAIDLDLFNIVTLEPVSIAFLHEKTSADLVHLTRITRCLAAINIFHESDIGMFSATEMSTSFRNPILAAWLKTTYDSSGPRFFKIPAHLSQSNYQEPLDIDAYNGSFFSGKSFWDSMSTQPSLLADFQTAMKLQDTQDPKTKADYDFAAQYRPAPPNSDIAIIDIGGGNGHALDTIIADHPNLPGRFILQDLPDTVAQLEPTFATRTIKFESMTHDFFTPQPPSQTLPKPRWYHLRSILHDWSDTHCLLILSHLRDALASSPQTSILLVERVLPDKGVTRLNALADLNMMMLGGMERSKTQWETLLAQVGLEVKSWTYAEVGARCVLDVGLKTVS